MHSFRLRFSPLLLAALAALSSTAQTTVKVDVGRPVAKVSPMLYGLMTEEINYSYDGGLYAELVRNRIMRGRHGTPDQWSLVEKGAVKAKWEVDHTTGPSSALPSSLKLTITAAADGASASVANEGYWGIPVKPSTTYQGSFFAKSQGDPGPLTIALIADKDGASLASARVTVHGADWKRYLFTLHSGNEPPTSQAHLVITASRPGTLWLDLVSLFPPTYKDRVNGNRIDLMEKLAAMHPAFLRFPGGNYLEGDHIEQRYEWKKTLGPMEDRPTHPSPWRYQSSDGMGLLEFLEWCEDLNMQPVLAVYAGYSMQQEFVKPGPDLDPYVQDALEEIDYVSGGPETTWGARRAKDGHPAPFKLQYVEIGNEDNFDKSGSYEGRYAQFYKAIKQAHPDLQLIATMPIKQMKADVVDDHYYRSQQQFYDTVDHYDAVDRSGPKIFVGEWATREGSPTTNLGAALGDAAWMTGMERNSDLIIMSAYAPLFVNVNPGAMQWESDLIGYDSMSSYGSPSYYAQVLFATHLGDNILKVDGGNSAERLFASATLDQKSGKVYLKLVNATTEPKPLQIKLDGAQSIAGSGRVYTLSGGGIWDTNTIQQPTRIVPVESQLSSVAASFSHTLPPLSIQVLELETRQ